MSHRFGMPPPFVSGTQTQSQPTTTSGSRYFHNGLHGHSTIQNRSRLAHLPSPARSSRAVISSQGTIPPLQIQQRPYPFFAGGPAARGYIPQKTPRFSRHPALQEPIVPLRQEFSAVHSVRDSERPVFSPGPEQIRRPYSVPAHYTQTSQYKNGHSSRAISRPASAIQHGLSRPNIKFVSGRNDETPGHSRTPTHDLYSSRSTDECIPPKRTLPFPTGDKPKAQNDRPEVQPERTAEKDEAQIIRPELSSKPKTGEKRDLSQRQNDDMQVPKRPTKIKLVSRSADDSQRPPLREYSSSTSGFTQPSQGRIRPNWVSEEVSEDSSNSWTPGLAHVPLPRTREHPPSTAIGPSSSNHQNKSSSDETREQILPDTTSTPIDPPIPAHTEIKRPASQASTISTTSTQSSPCSTGVTNQRDDVNVADSSNALSMTDMSVILERDISDIVVARLDEGNPDLLDAVHGEILIKMASRDDVLFDVVSKVLKS